MQALDHESEVITEPMECAPCWGLCIACPHCSQRPVPSPAPILGLSTLFLAIQLRESLLKGGVKGVSLHPLPSHTTRLGQGSLSWLPVSISLLNRELPRRQDCSAFLCFFSAPLPRPQLGLSQSPVDYEW